MSEVSTTPSPPNNTSAVRPTVGFMLRHPAHLMAMGFGVGLSPKAPGTMGTLWAWLAFWVMQPWLNNTQLGWLMAISLGLGWWASATTARNLRTTDPGCVVWDEIAAFWLVLWLIGPASLWVQLIAFALFRFFDAVKPGPVGWADRLYHDVDPSTDPNAWMKAGWGIMLDDYVAAACTLLTMLVLLWFLPGGHMDGTHWFGGMMH
jgi:phosphatidylglycerophosphatase A